MPRRQTLVADKRVLLHGATRFLLEGRSSADDIE